MYFLAFMREIQHVQEDGRKVRLIGLFIRTQKELVKNLKYHTAFKQSLDIALQELATLEEMHRTLIEKG